MGYELLSKLYYKDIQLFDKEYVQRKDGPYSVSLGFDIHGHEAFYVNIPDFVTMTSRLYKKLSEINKLCDALPKVAYKSYERNCLIDEIILSNDIEGIRSTRKEIINVLDSDKVSQKKKRFDGMVWKYVLLLDDAEHPYDVSLKSSRDVRELYDEIVLDEIEPINHPDGEIFRKDLAEVVSGTQQVKHIGVHPESKIIECIDNTLRIFERNDITELYKIAILHYMIGYIHPFYDGNGRLSRFMSSYLLKKEFNTLIALRLSYIIKDRKSDYYKAFDITNDPHNMGDLTYFILYFSQVIEHAEDYLIERLRDGKETLYSYGSLLKNKYKNLEPTEKKKTQDVLWYLIQNNLFSNEYMDKQFLANLLKTSTVTVHHYVEKLIESGAPIEIAKEGRKFIYKLHINSLVEFLRSGD